MTFTFSSVGLDVKPVSEIANEQTGFDIMPNHSNQLVITDMKYYDSAIENPTKGSLSAKFTVEVTVVGDQYNGRKIWNDYWVKGKDGKGNRVAQIQMNAIAEAIGFVGVLDNPFDMLPVQKPFQADIYIEPNNDPQYKDRNRFKNPKGIVMAKPAQHAQGFSAPQQGFTAPQAQQQPFAPQQQQSNPFPQQGGMPPFAMQQ